MYESLIQKMCEHPSPPTGIKDIFNNEVVEGDIVQTVEFRYENGFNLGCKGVVYCRDDNFYIGWSYSGLAEPLSNFDVIKQNRGTVKNNKGLLIIGDIVTSPERADDGGIIDCNN